MNASAELRAEFEALFQDFEQLEPVPAMPVLFGLHDARQFLDEFEQRWPAGLAPETAAERRVQFEALFEAFERLEQARPQPSRFGIDEARQLLDGFEQRWPAYIEARAENPLSLNIWSVAGLGADEVRNCEVLHWLLDPHGSHWQGRRFLRCFLAALGEHTEIADEHPLSVRREVANSAGESRVDLLIETRSTLLAIEAKIGASEGPGQLARYHAWLSQRAEFRSKRFVGKMLTFDGESGEPVSEGFTRLLWSDIAVALRCFSGLEGADGFVARSPFLRDLATQYADFIKGGFGR